MKRNSDVLSSVSFLLVFWCCVAVCSTAPSNILKCHYKTYSHRAEQTDFNGLRCWGDVKIKSCGGYCRSHEISHWEFPYKKSFHPVCVHGARKHALIKLSNCDPGVEPGTEMYHYLEAINCKCQVCSSEDTSCEWLPPDSSLIKGFSSESSEISNEIDDYTMD